MRSWARPNSKSWPHFFCNQTAPGICSGWLSKIAPLVRDLEGKLGRAINPTVYAREEFERRVQRENHFLTTVLREKPLFITGGPDELAKLTAGAMRQITSHQPSRIERS